MRRLRGAVRLDRVDLHYKCTRVDRQLCAKITTVPQVAAATTSVSLSVSLSVYLSVSLSLCISRRVASFGTFAFLFTFDFTHNFRGKVHLRRDDKRRIRRSMKITYSHSYICISQIHTARDSSIYSHNGQRVLCSK